jgi:hypothetical protein
MEIAFIVISSTEDKFLTIFPQVHNVKRKKILNYYTIMYTKNIFLSRWEEREKRGKCIEKLTM